MQVLVGNKCDMEESKRKVPYSQGQALADEFGIQFFETSAKNNIKVDEVRGSPCLQKPHWKAHHRLSNVCAGCPTPLYLSRQVCRSSLVCTSMTHLKENF